MNAPGVTGTGPYPQNVDGCRRMATAQTYIAKARSRPNLTLRADLGVDKLAVDSSIIAVPVRARPASTMMMLGERLAQLIDEETRVS